MHRAIACLFMLD